MAGYIGLRVYLRLLDRILFRRPFQGSGARRYARDERRAFGDLDDRLLDRLAPELAPAGRRLLDLGSGPGTLARRAAARFAGLCVVAIEPSRDFAGLAAPAGLTGLTGPGMVRAVGEALPLADRTIDVAICLSSIRHVRDRRATLRELRRVVRGRLVIVELDPAADQGRVAHHADRIASPILRRTFGPLVLRTAPPAEAIARLAAQAGFALRDLAVDPIQPVYVMELV